MLFLYGGFMATYYQITYLDKGGKGYSSTEPWIEDNFDSYLEAKKHKKWIEKEGYKNIRIIIRDDEKGYVIAKIGDVLYYAGNKKAVNFIPDAIIYKTEEDASRDLKDNYSLDEWEIREIEISYAIK